MVYHCNFGLEVLLLCSILLDLFLTLLGAKEVVVRNVLWQVALEKKQLGLAMLTMGFQEAHIDVKELVAERL